MLVVLVYLINVISVQRIDIKMTPVLWEHLFVSEKGTKYNKEVIVGNTYKPPKDDYIIENINAFYNRHWKCHTQTKQEEFRNSYCPRL